LHSGARELRWRCVRAWKRKEKVRGGSTPAFKERRRKRETTVGVESNGH
jgi:hypothetical protein